MKTIGGCKMILLAALVAGGMASEADAASVSYLLDQSNVLPNGVDYLQVTIDDQGAPGNINFTVTPLSSLQAGSHFGIQKFAFNGAGLSRANILFTGASSSGWSVSKNKNVSEFGSFGTLLAGKGQHRADPLTFSITGIAGDSIDSYTVLSTGGNSVLLSAHVAGLGNRHLRSGYFGGSTNMVTPSSVVPLPAAASLFGTGLIGLLGVAMRKSKTRRG